MSTTSGTWDQLGVYTPTYVDLLVNLLSLLDISSRRHGHVSLFGAFFSQIGQLEVRKGISWRIASERGVRFISVHFQTNTRPILPFQKKGEKQTSLQFLCFWNNKAMSGTTVIIYASGEMTPIRKFVMAKTRQEQDNGTPLTKEQ